MNRALVAVATVLAIAGCKKNEPVTAAPIAPPAGGMAPMAQGGAPQGAMPPPSSMPPGMAPGAGMPQGGMPPGGMPPGGMMGAPAGMGGGSSFDQQISVAQQLAAQNPKSAQAWASLGNLYFDSFKAGGDRQRAQAAIDAYQKAIDLDPKNADVMTDQGVMYRDLGQLDKALATFLKANQVNPQHMQSLMNAGVVYVDKGDAKKAEETWLKVVANDRTGQFAAQAGNAIAQLRQQRPGMPGAPGAPPPPAR